VIKEGKAVAIAAVANKEHDYDENDLLHLSLYLESAWNMIKRKQAEEQSQELGNRLSTIIDFLPDATFAIDLSGKVIVWNRAIEEMTGVKAKDMLGKGDYEYGIPFYGTRRPILIDVVSEFKGVSKKKYSVVKKEDRILLAEADVTLKGIPRVLWGTAGPLYDGHGNIAGAIESVRDITEFRQAENEFKKYAAEIDDLYNNAPCGYHSLAPDGKFLHINDTELKWLGYDRDELIGRKTLFDLLTQDSQTIFHNTFKILKTGSQAINREYDVIRKNGSLFQILVNARPVLNEVGTFLESRSTTFDITELKKIQTELQKKNLELAEAYEELKKKQDMIIQQEKMASIGMLAAGIAHEIKNPLAIVLQGIDYLQTAVTNDALMIEVVERMRNAVKRADIIIKGLLSFARQNYLSLTKQDISIL
jgi:PAS domain S-box-containing protein